MSYCSIQDNSGFVRVTGELSSAKLSPVKVNQKPPISLTVSQRTVPPTRLSNWNIDDLVGNTCTYNNESYDMVAMQLCKPLHSMQYGYRLPETPSEGSVGELILSFSLRTPSGNRPRQTVGILLCFPVYRSPYSASRNSAYLTQLSESHVDVSKVKTIANLFDDSQSSLAYTTCFETTSKTGILYVLVFPSGITYQDANTAPLTLSEYGLPLSIRSYEATMQYYALNAGNKDPSSMVWSNDGNLYISHMSVDSEEFQTRFQYFTISPLFRKETDSVAVNTYRHMCVPFTQYGDLGQYKNSQIHPGNITLDRVLVEQYDTQQAQAKIDTVKENMSSSMMEGLFAGIIVLILFVLLIIVYNWSSSPAAPKTTVHVKPAPVNTAAT